MNMNPREPRTAHEAKTGNLDTETSVDARLREAAQARPAGAAGRLDPASGKRRYDSQTAVHPLVAQERYSGNYEDGLTHLVMVGNFTLGISRGFNKKRVGGEGTPIESVRVSVLPIGDHQAASKQSSVTLFEVNPRILGNRRENGVVQPFETLTIGRDMLEVATGTKDDLVSRDHLDVTVNHDGSITLIDKSTNGTQVLTDTDLLKPEEYGGLRQDGKLAMADMLQELQENPWEWQADSAGRTVITDAQ
jgi:hypothetical protein